MANPDVDKFFSDPKHAEDREFFRKVNERYMEEGLKAAAERKKNPTSIPANYAPNVFDKLGAMLGGDSSDAGDSIFDRVFGGKK